MTIKHPFYTSCLAGIAFIGPHSEALFSYTSSSTSAAYSQYNCSLGYQQKRIMVKQPVETSPSSCQVSWQQGNGKNKLLWDAQRNIGTCEKSAEAIALRLKDRGWQCQYSRLSL